MDEQKDQNVKQFALRLARSAKEAVQVLARREGISANHFISLAVAEKISRIEVQRKAAAAAADNGLREQNPLAGPEST